MAVFADDAWRADLAVVVRCTQEAAQRYATQALHLAGMAARVPAPVGTGEGAIAWQSFIREIAVARGVQDTAALHDIQRAVLLSRHLPATLAQLANGTVTLERARAFLDELLHVEPALARHVDRELAERISLLPPVRIRQQVRREIDRCDADAAAARAARATRERGVRRTAERDGQASAAITGPAIPLARWYAALTDAARARRAAGDPRGLDALRFDLLVAGFTADNDPGMKPPPATAPTVSTPRPAPTPSSPAPSSAPPSAPPQSDPAGGTEPPSRVKQPAGPAEPSGSADADHSDGCAPADAATDDLHDGDGLVSDADADELISDARVEADGLVRDAQAEAAAVLEAAHASEAAAVVRMRRAQAEADRLAALVIVEP